MGREVLVSVLGKGGWMVVEEAQICEISETGVIIYTKGSDCQIR